MAVFYNSYHVPAIMFKLPMLSKLLTISKLLTLNNLLILPENSVNDDPVMLNNNLIIIMCSGYQWNC